MHFLPGQAWDILSRNIYFTLARFRALRSRMIAVFGENENAFSSLLAEVDRVRLAPGRSISLFGMLFNLTEYTH